MVKKASRAERKSKSSRKIRLRLNMWLLPVLVGLALILRFSVPYDGWTILLAGLGGALLVCYLWARWLARGLSFARRIRFGWVQVGDRLEEQFELRNESWVPALWIEIIDHSTVPGCPGGRGSGVEGRSIVRWRESAVCARRGLFSIGPTTLMTGDPFGVFTVSQHYSESVSFLVLPPIIPLPGLKIFPGGRSGDDRPRADAPDHTVSASSVRAYVPGDSLRWVHWRTSARRDSLFVRHFDGVPSGDWWIVLDMDQCVQVGEGQDSTAEHGVILATSLADQGLRAKQAVGLVTQGQDLLWLPPKEGDYQRWEILRALALVSPGATALSDLLAKEGSAFGQSVSLIIITPSVDGEWVESLVPLLRRGITPMVLLLDPVSFGGAGDVRGMVALLADLGIPHHVVTRDLLDRPEARPGQEGQWEWRVLGTGRAVAVRHPLDTHWRGLS
jgi:uncharacterized protein (DUF58 family)